MCLCFTSLSRLTPPISCLSDWCPCSQAVECSEVKGLSCVTAQEEVHDSVGQRLRTQDDDFVAHLALKYSYRPLESHNYLMTCMMASLGSISKG